MRIGASLLLIAAGAILRFAITPHYSHGVNWATIGVVLMIVGAIGGLIGLAFMTTRRRTDVTYRTEPAIPQAGLPAGYVATNPPDPRYASATYVEPPPMDPRV